MRSALRLKHIFKRPHRMGPQRTGSSGLTVPEWMLSHFFLLCDVLRFVAQYLRQAIGSAE